MPLDLKFEVSIFQIFRAIFPWCHGLRWVCFQQVWWVQSRHFKSWGACALCPFEQTSRWSVPSRLALMRLVLAIFCCGSCVVCTICFTYIFWVVVFLICRQAKAIQCIYIVTCLSLSLIMSTVRQPPIHQESGEWRLSMLDGTGGHVDVSLNLRTPESWDIDYDTAWDVWIIVICTIFHPFSTGISGGMDPSWAGAPPFSGESEEPPSLVFRCICCMKNCRRLDNNCLKLTSMVSLRHQTLARLKLLKPYAGRLQKIDVWVLKLCLFEQCLKPRILVEHLWSYHFCYFVGEIQLIRTAMCCQRETSTWIFMGSCKPTRRQEGRFWKKNTRGRRASSVFLFVIFWFLVHKGIW